MFKFIKQALIALPSFSRSLTRIGMLLCKMHILKGTIFDN